MELMINFRIALYYAEYGCFYIFFRKANNKLEALNNFAQECINDKWLQEKVEQAERFSIHRILD